MSVVVFNWYGQPDQPDVPELIAARAIARNTVELEFDKPAIVREKTATITPPADRFTPVTWGGNSWDAANPANYTFTRPNGGALDGPGEAVELVATYAEEDEETAAESNIGGTDYIVSTKVWVHTDFQHTARAGYHVLVENVRGGPAGPALPDDADEADWTGYTPSQVSRASLRIIETLPGILRRMDDEGTGDLAGFFTAVQEVFERVLEDVDAFFYDLCEIDRARPEFLDAILYDLGNPFFGLLDLTTNEKRKLISLLVDMYREKGTCEGIVNAVLVFTGLQLSGCSNAWVDTWRLHGGSYPTTTQPRGGPYKLDLNARLGPGGGSERWSFWLLHPTPGSITAAQLAIIAAIVDYMKPAASHYLGVRAP